ncbi:hypothetical protein Tco_1194282 [Tanacetum coccineum]
MNDLGVYQLILERENELLVKLLEKLELNTTLNNSGDARHDKTHSVSPIPTIATSHMTPVSFHASGLTGPVYYVPSAHAPAQQFSPVVPFMPAQPVSIPPGFSYPLAQQPITAQQPTPAHLFGYKVMGPTQQLQSGLTRSTVTSGQATTLPHAFTAETLHDPNTGTWNMDIGASSHLNNSVTSLSDVFNTCIYSSISVGDGHSIPVTNKGHSILPTSARSLHLNNVLITPHINCTIEFDAFGFSV